MSEELWGFAFATISYLVLMGIALTYFLKLRKMLYPSKMFSRLLIVQTAELSWMAVAVFAAFNMAVQNMPTNPAAMIFRYFVLLIVPLVVSSTLIFVWRNLLQDFRNRLHQ